MSVVFNVSVLIYPHYLIPTSRNSTSIVYVIKSCKIVLKEAFNQLYMRICRVLKDVHSLQSFGRNLIQLSHLTLKKC